MMAAQSTLLSFKVTLGSIRNPVISKTLQQDALYHLKKLGLHVGHDFGDLGEDQGFLVQYLHPSGSYATLRGYTQGLLTLDLNEYVTDESKAIFSKEKVSQLERSLKNHFLATVSKSLPPIKRGSALDVYWPSVDERLFEYDIDKLVYEENSPYQNIKILHSHSFGNMLILDNDINLSESDIAYTQSLLGAGSIDYEGKTVLILGGGDGGLLNELRKENPKMITMVDIDEMVVQAAKKYLRGICSDSFDKMKGHNYEVVIGDALQYLEQYIDEGRQFDFVIYDITVVPVTPDPTGDEWDFLRQAFDLGLQVVAPEGKYLTHANAKLAHTTIKMFEDEMSNMRIPVQWKKREAFIPSFHEIWVFYEMSRKASSNGTTKG